MVVVEDGDGAGSRLFIGAITARKLPNKPAK